MALFGGPILVDSPSALAPRLADLGREPLVAADVESDGLHAHRAKACLVTIATPSRVVVFDTLALPAAALADLLGDRGPTKIVHDVAFDARLLCDASAPLGNVHDTSVCAAMLGRTKLGLANLLEAELGIKVEKALQHKDWRERPLDGRSIGYLEGDVKHLFALHDKLWREAAAAGIVDEVTAETLYRLETAREVDARPAYTKLTGALDLPPVQRAALRHLAAARDALARDRDVPPHRIAPNDALVAIARAMPSTDSALRAAWQGALAWELASPALYAVRQALDDGDVPEADLVYFARTEPSPAVRDLRKRRRARILSWRAAEAKRRGVSEQVVLPGHCVTALADLDQADLTAIAAVHGLSAGRVERYGDALAALLGAPG